MAKRFTDTDIWDKEWFMLLSCKHKCLIRYIFDKCDVAGIWSINWALASTYIGEKVTEEDLIFIKDQIVILPNSKIFVPGFIKFQYGELSEKCKPHIKVINLLKRYDLFERVSKGYTKVIETFEEKDKKRMSELKIEDCKLPKNSPEYGVIDASINLYEGFCKNVNNRDLKFMPVSEWVPAVRSLMIKKGYTYDQIKKVLLFAWNDKFWKTRIIDMNSLVNSFEKIKNQHHES